MKLSRRALAFPGQQRSCGHWADYCPMPQAPENLSRLVVAVVMNQMRCSSLFPPLSQGSPSSMFVCQLISALLPPQRLRSHISSISHPFLCTLSFSFSTTCSLFALFINYSIIYAIPKNLVYPPFIGRESGTYLDDICRPTTISCRPHQLFLFLVSGVLDVGGSRRLCRQHPYLPRW